MNRRAAYLRRSVVLLAALIAVGALATDASAARRHVSRPLVKVLLPKPGNVGIEVFRLKFTGRARRGLPRKVRLTGPGAARLSPSVRVLTVTRRIVTRKATTFAILVISVRKAGAAKSSAAGFAGARAAIGLGGLLAELRFKEHVAHSDQLRTFREVLEGQLKKTPHCGHCGNEHCTFPCPKNSGGHNFWGKCPNCNKHTGCPVCDPNHVEAVVSPNLSALQSAQAVAPVRKTLQDLFSGVAGNDPLIFEGGEPADPSIETGHYDDGHSFGWNVKTSQQIVQVADGAVTTIVRGTWTNLVQSVEINTGVDLNGDGAVGGSGGGQQVNTIVGPPTVSPGP